MSWSVGFGPVRYHEPARRGSVLLTTLAVLVGFAAAALVLAVLVLFGVVVVAAWIWGFLRDLFTLDPENRPVEYATAVLDWGRDLVKPETRV